MKLGYNLQVVLALTLLLEEHLKYRAIEPEVELHLEGHADGDCVIFVVLAPQCHWNLLLDQKAHLQLNEQTSPSHFVHSQEQLSREGSPEQLARAVFERIKARLAVIYTPRP